MRVYTRFLLPVVLGCVSGCVVSEPTRMTSESAAAENERVSQLFLKNGMTVDFDDMGGRFSSRHSGLRGVTRLGLPVFVSLDRIAQFRMGPAGSVHEDELAGATVTEVVLAYREQLVVFDRDGARYDSTCHIVTGRKVTGELFSYPVDKMVSIRTSPPETLTRAEFLQSRLRAVGEVVTSEGRLIMFSQKGATYAESVNVFLGRNTIGDVVEVPLDDVFEANVGSIDAVRTGAALGGGTLLVLVLLFWNW